MTTAERPCAQAQRPRIRELGEVRGQEREDLRRCLGGLLSLERRHFRPGGISTAELAEAAGLNPRTIKDLERGHRRPSTTTTWKLARALRPDGTLRDRVVVDERLRRAAGPSLRDFTRRANATRENMRAEVVAGCGVAVPVGTGESVAMVAGIVTILDAPSSVAPS